MVCSHTGNGRISADTGHRLGYDRFRLLQRQGMVSCIFYDWYPQRSVPRGRTKRSGNTGSARLLYGDRALSYSPEETFINGGIQNGKREI